MSKGRPALRTPAGCARPAGSRAEGARGQSDHRHEHAECNEFGDVEQGENGGFTHHGLRDHGRGTICSLFVLVKLTCRMVLSELGHWLMEIRTVRESAVALLGSVGTHAAAF